MAIEVKEVASVQTANGQPLDATEHTVSEDDGGAAGGTETETVEPADNGDGQSTTPATTTVAVDISPETLRQITALSTSNRTLKQQLREAQDKLAAAASVTPEEVQAKLAQLAALENETPRAYLKRTGKTLDDVAADALADDKEIADPRVDGLQAKLNETNKKLEEIAQKNTSDAEAEAKARLEARQENARQHVKGMIESNPTRWELIAANKTITDEAIKAAMLVVQRDHTDKQTGKLKPISQELANSILSDCLDEAETYALAKKMQEDKKNVASKPESLVKRKGIETQDSPSYVPHKGDDGKQANGARTPKVTIDGNRGATRVGAVKRGPTDVRTARLRALKIAGADVDEDT